MKTIKQLLITIAVLLCSATASAYDFEVDGIYYNIISTTDLTVKVTSGDNNYSGEIIIPSAITYKSRTLKVVAIGDKAFFRCDSLVNITIPNSVTSIGDQAFYGCSALASAVIPNSVTTIENTAFDGCNSLTDLCIEDGENPLSLGYQRKGGYSYGNYFNGLGLFISCPLEKLYLGRNLSYETGETYGYSPFYDITTLTSVTIGNNVTKIGHSIFRGCEGLTNITIPNSVTTIENLAFGGCTSLKELYIEDGETILELGYLLAHYKESDSKGLFYDCPLEKIHLGRNVNYKINEDRDFYGNSPFYNRTSLKILTISNYVTEIRGNAFEGCSSLSEVIIPNSVTSIEYEAFKGCTGLTSVTIGNSVTSIGRSAFEYCSNLTSVTIPNSVTEINFAAFDDCTSLKEICVEDGTSTLYWGTYGYYNSYFYRCPIEKVYLGRNLGFRGNDYGWFYSISNRISSLTIGNCVTRICDEVFWNLAQDVNIYLMCTNSPTISPKSDAAYVNWNIYVPQGTLDVYQNANVWKEFWNIYEKGTTEMPNVDIKVKECATPVIAYNDNGLDITTETDGAEIHTNITCNDVGSYNGSRIDLSETYSITTYATKSGYQNSETVTATLCWIAVNGDSEDNSVIEVEAMPVLITCNNGTIIICGGIEGAEVVVYTTSGVAVGNATITNGNATISTGLAKGEIAVVNIAGKGIKIVMQ